LDKEKHSRSYRFEDREVQFTVNSPTMFLEKEE
jgi:hypothetical protein